MRSAESNFSALRSLAVLYFADLRRQHPDWYAEDLFAFLNLPQTTLLLDLAETAGFQPRSAPTPEEMLAVAKAVLNGISDLQIIASKTGIPAERVRAILDMRESGYGTSPYGKAPYGGNRKFSDGKTLVPRRVTRQGQLSYRGHLYSLGRAYKLRQATVKERGRDILVRFQDGEELTMLDRRNVVKRTD